MVRFASCLLLTTSLFLAIAPGPSLATEKPYVPDLGDFMGMTQLRHFKLFYAGRTQNWSLADYEIGQIRKSFENVMEFYPKFGDTDMAKMIEVDSFGPLDALGRAASSHDLKAFRVQFDKLTSACNACHEATGFGFIKIGVPTASPFTNQVFGPTLK